MLKYLKSDSLKKASVFATGVLFGTVGIKALTSKDAKKVYTSCTARALKAKDMAMCTVSNIQENIEDIVAEAKILNEVDEAGSDELVEKTENLEKLEVVDEELKTDEHKSKKAKNK